MLTLLTLFHILIAAILILIVLLQSARGTDLAGAFGGMGSQTAFGPRGTATFLSKATVVLAILFMVTSVSLAILSNRLRGAGGPSVLSGEPASQTQPAAPAPATPTPAPPGSTAPQVQTVTIPPPAPAPTAAPAAPAATPGAPPVQVPATPPGQAPAEPPSR
ncbi:MAG: preprotein translocase subunit SecG [Acidobacteria bacterium RIFCSPLOWO2_12_FULL_60_22]|nr:MAG: preprotein translocase subunit SecG [Acidobacteria bacterium RIFCSPLOWO2_12_FULL_60_22]